jgi:hypothetical protein
MADSPCSATVSGALEAVFMPRGDGCHREVKLPKELLAIYAISWIESDREGFRAKTE